MPERRPPIACPRCGAPMNHHAEKPVEPRTPEEWRSAEAGLGCVLEAIHQCPKCGSIEARRE
jgi:hypothetical protein